MPRIARDHILSLAKLVVDYALQPIIEINTGYVYGYEALLRGYERLNLTSPVELLDAANQAGALVPFEQMLHARAIAKFARLPDTKGKRLFINIDGRTLHSGHGMLEAAAQAMKHQNLPASAICFELSERYDNDAEPGFGTVVRSLHAMGGRVAVDDFGFGYSELKLLCDYGIDYVKIDGYFIRGMMESQRKRLFVSTIANLAHVLGIRVVAEGVETEAEYVACREAGCDLVQGFFVAHPTCEVSELRDTYSQILISGAQRRHERKTDQSLIRGQLANLPTIFGDLDLSAAFDLFLNAPQERFFPVVDDSGEPRGLIHERDIKPFIYRPFGRDLLQNPSYQQRVSSLMVTCPIVDINTDAERILEVFANAHDAEGVIITENLRYVGVLSAAALLAVINNKQLRLAQDQNPLTELPGNLAITDFVTTTALDDSQDRHFCYFDFDQFKPFNDRYGFAKGDRAIVLFATLLHRHLNAFGVFLGHIGGDDFFAGFCGQDRDKVSAVIELLVEEFACTARKLYSAEDQRKGYIVATDRDGQERRFDLLRCSAATVELPAGVQTSDLDKIYAAMARAKSEAKRTASGNVWCTYTG